MFILVSSNIFVFCLFTSYVRVTQRSTVEELFPSLRIPAIRNRRSWPNRADWSPGTGSWSAGRARSASDHSERLSVCHSSHLRGAGVQWIEFNGQRVRWINGPDGRRRSGVGGCRWSGHWTGDEIRKQRHQASSGLSNFDRYFGMLMQND